MVSLSKRNRHPRLRQPRVKICGLCHREQASHAAQAGADAIGLVLYAKSPRYVDLEQAARIRASLPPFVTAVALVVNPTHQEVMDIVTRVRPHLLQFHGGEDEEFCRSFSTPYIKAVHAKSASYIEQQVGAYVSASALLLDTHSAESYGGTGETFDYALIPEDLPLPLILAGGLNPANVRTAIERLKPYAVDVSSGVESSIGEKDPAKVAAFIQAAVGQ